MANVASIRSEGDLLLVLFVLLNVAFLSVFQDVSFVQLVLEDFAIS
jgi:hypothetical protein